MELQCVTFSFSYKLLPFTPPLHTCHQKSHLYDFYHALTQDIVHKPRIHNRISYWHSHSRIGQLVMNEQVMMTNQTLTQVLASVTALRTQSSSYPAQAHHWIPFHSEQHLQCNAKMCLGSCNGIVLGLPATSDNSLAWRSNRVTIVGIWALSLNRLCKGRVETWGLLHFCTSGSTTSKNLSQRAASFHCTLEMREGHQHSVVHKVHLHVTK